MIDILNELLTMELSAADQYLLNAAVCDDWGYERLEKAFLEEANEEREHARKIIDRILYLGGLPIMAPSFLPCKYEDVANMLRSAHYLETKVVRDLQSKIISCVNDYGTRKLLEEILLDEEEAIEWVEAQQDQILQLGEVEYLAQQIREWASVPSAPPRIRATRRISNPSRIKPYGSRRRPMRGL